MEKKITDGNDPIVQTVYRQVGKESYRPATSKEINEGTYLVHREGLTKREYFAAMAMQGLLAGNSQVKDIKVAAVTYADELISELNKPYTNGQ